MNMHSPGVDWDWAGAAVNWSPHSGSCRVRLLNTLLSPLCDAWVCVWVCALSCLAALAIAAALYLTHVLRCASCPPPARGPTPAAGHVVLVLRDCPCMPPAQGVCWQGLNHEASQLEPSLSCRQQHSFVSWLPAQAYCWHKQPAQDPAGWLSHCVLVHDAVLGLHGAGNVCCLWVQDTGIWTVCNARPLCS